MTRVNLKVPIIVESQEDYHYNVNGLLAESFELDGSSHLLAVKDVRKLTFSGTRNTLTIPPPESINLIIPIRNVLSIQKGIVA